MAADVSQGQDKLPLSNINVTPFVDVMLVLLVIFMVTAPIIQQGVEVNLPQAKASPVVGEAEPLIVSISREGRVYLNDNEVTPAELRTKLQAIRNLDAQKPVYLRADRDVRYGSVIATIGEIKGAGIERLGMIALPLADQ
jgi:biopolymer transport protein TolR